MGNSSIDQAEINRFARSAAHWWETDGEFATLHAINPIRMAYIQQRVNLLGKKIIDVGCGGGILAESLDQAGAEVTGIDACDALLEVAKLHQLESGTNVDYLSVSIEDISRSHPEAFDGLTCLEMLEHVNDPASVVQACAQLVKPGGDLFFSTLNRNPKSWLFAILGAEYLFKLLPRHTHDFRKFIRPAELCTWIRDAGLIVNDLTGMHYNPFTRQASLTPDTSVNYLLHARKP